MLNENIRKYRKVKGISQETLAVKLHVVRQTISKWENGLSIPNAEQVVQLAEVLGISANQLLGTEAGDESVERLTEELAGLKEQLSEKNQREGLMIQANRKRGLILFLSLLTMVMILVSQNAVVSIALAGVCLLAAIVILYRNLALLTSITTRDLRIGVLKATTIFAGGMVILCIAAALLIELELVPISQRDEEMFAVMLIFCFMIFTGIISPRLPFNRHTGLRLPWTTQDEDTWKIAHKILGYLSAPVAVLYLACAWTISNLKAVTLIIMATWIGIPGLISFVFFWKKFHGKP